MESSSVIDSESSLINSIDDIGLLLQSMTQKCIRNLPGKYKILAFILNILGLIVAFSFLVGTLMVAIGLVKI